MPSSIRFKVSISELLAHDVLLKLSCSAETEIIGKNLSVMGPAILRSRPVAVLTELDSNLAS